MSLLEKVVTGRAVRIRPAAGHLYDLRLQFAFLTGSRPPNHGGLSTRKFLVCAAARAVGSWSWSFGGHGSRGAAMDEGIDGLVAAGPETSRA
jgi:hypothetical protein